MTIEIGSQIRCIAPITGGPVVGQTYTVSSISGSHLELVGFPRSEMFSADHFELLSLTYEERSPYACDVCGNVPDVTGRIEHGKGCYTQSVDGGGESYVELPHAPSPRPLPLDVELTRDTSGIPCACGGYCDHVDSTAAECKEFGCGRDTPGRECCAASFVCRICGARYAGSKPAPELEGF